MKGITVKQQGASPEITDDLGLPEPSGDQILVKSIYTAINPVDHMMMNMGILVQSWPFVPGCDAAGVVVKVGEKATSIFNIGDEVCGCTRLGTEGYSTCQEYFLMEARLALPKPRNLSLPEAATIGVGVETAALGVLNGCNLTLPDPACMPSVKDEWALILGGSSNVGRFGIQLFKTCGYKVIASCSTQSAETVKAVGADIVFDYKQSIPEQVGHVLATLHNTKADLLYVFDAAATGDGLTRQLFQELPTKHRYFATTNDWSGITDFGGGTTYLVRLGLIGRDDAPEVNESIASYIPGIGKLFESGHLLPSPYVEIGAGGFGAALEALEYQKLGSAGSKKVVVKLQEI